MWRTAYSLDEEHLRVCDLKFGGVERMLTCLMPVNELLPPKPLVGSTASFMQPLPPSPRAPATPISQAVNGGTRSAEPIPGAVLSKWSETAATIKSNTTAGDSAAMTALGDALIRNEWPEAAHAWYAAFCSRYIGASLTLHIFFGLQLPSLAADLTPGWRRCTLDKSCPSRLGKSGPEDDIPC